MKLRQPLGSAGQPALGLLWVSLVLLLLLLSLLLSKLLARLLEFEGPRDLLAGHLFNGVGWILRLCLVARAVELVVDLRVVAWFHVEQFCNFAG